VRDDKTLLTQVMKLLFTQNQMIEITHLKLVISQIIYSILSKNNLSDFGKIV
jgi:hypothetical protein